MYSIAFFSQAENVLQYQACAFRSYDTHDRMVNFCVLRYHSGTVLYYNQINRTIWSYIRHLGNKVSSAVSSSSSSDFFIKSSQAEPCTRSGSKQ